LKTPEEIMRKVTQKAMENHHILSETKLASAVGCGQGSISKLLNETPVKLTQEQWFNLCTLANVLNVGG
jgi:hypothetical protein